MTHDLDLILKLMGAALTLESPVGKFSLIMRGLKTDVADRTKIATLAFPIKRATIESYINGLSSGYKCRVTRVPRMGGTVTRFGSGSI